MASPVVGASTAIGVPWWGRLSSLLAPVLLIGGWSLAAARQPGGFDPVTGTISALAALDAADRWVMTLGIAGTGVCHLVTAAALRPAARTGRVLLACGGAATLLVALLPLGGSAAVGAGHAVAALAAFVLLSVWPAGSPAGTSGAPWGLRRPVARAAAAVLLLLTALFLAAVVVPLPAVGALERLAAGAQALWPAVVVATVRPSGSRSGDAPSG